MTAYVGIDLHRRRSLAVCLDDGGSVCGGGGSITRRRCWPGWCRRPARMRWW